MIRMLQVLLALSLSVTAHAGEDFDRAMTAFTAMALNQIKSLEDLQKYDLGKANAEILKTELSKNAGPPFAPKKIMQVDATTLKLEFSGSTVTLGTQELAQNLIYVNGRKVKLEKNKTYYNYKAEIDEILKSKKNAFMRLLIGEDAHAEDSDAARYLGFGLSRIQRALIGGVVVENLESSDVPDAYLESEILAAYRYAIQSQKPNATAVTSRFECEGKRVKSITQAAYLPSGQVDGQPMASMSEMLNGSWSMINFISNDSARARADGTVVKDGQPSTDNIFNRDPFYQFPQVAKRCCAKVGCGEKVKRGLNRALGTLAPTRQSGGAQ